jgi:hypothetical protein
MGFSHDATTHHFHQLKDGGEIVVTAKNVSDSAGVNRIRMHLAHIAQMFSVEDFNAPMLIHDTNPPGVATSDPMKSRSRFKPTPIDRGAQIRILTASPEATDAIPEFLLFQIVDHQTGDAPTIG